MDTRQLPQALNDLERDIGETVRQKLQDFQKETGLSARAVTLNFVEVTTAGDISPRSQLAEVVVDINI